jgi:chromosome segregation and condensation protein ScpB
LQRVKAREPRARARPASAATALIAQAAAVRQSREQADAVALVEVKSLAETLEVPLAKVAELLADDREDYVLLTALALAANAKEVPLFTKSTVDAYIATVIEL